MKKIGLFKSLVILFTMGATAISYSLLPKDLAIHFNTDFSPDMFMQKWLGLVIIPLLMVIFTGTEYYGKEKVNQETKVEFEYCFRLLLILLAIVQFSIIAYGLGYSIPTGQFSLLGTGAFMLFVAVYLAYSKKVFRFLTFLGFKKTDAYSRNLWKRITMITLVTTGLICLIMAVFIQEDPSLLMMGMLFIMGVIVIGSGVYLNKR